MERRMPVTLKKYADIIFYLLLLIFAGKCKFSSQQLRRGCVWFCGTRVIWELKM